MFDSGLNEELQSLKVDVSQLLNMAGEGFDATKARADTLTDQIKAALNELGETLSQNEEQVGRLIAERPIASLASAFALGLAVGLMFRRH